MTNEPSPTSPNPRGHHFLVKGQYVKDLSFENPLAPQSLLSLAEKPKIDIGVNLGAQKLQENLFELGMNITVRATVKETTLFLVELAYGGMFQLIDVPEDMIEPVLLVDCPFVLFPFARRVIADATRDGGFPPLMLEPIDFLALYQQNRAQMEKTA